MATIASYTSTGTKAATTAKLDNTVFGVNVDNHALLKEAYVAYLANGRTNNASTKTRGLISGGGRKPWKQKGTGRARFGSSRNPIWRGGGIVFGPTGEENYTKNMNVKAKRLAIRQALSLAASGGQIKVIDNLECDGKVSKIVNFLKKIDARGSILLVVPDKNDLVIRSTRNIPKIKVVQSTYLNTYDILNADVIVINKIALTAISDWLGSK